MRALQVRQLRQDSDRQELLRALRAFRAGDFSIRMRTDLPGVDGEIAGAFNDIVKLNQTMAAEWTGLHDRIGRQGNVNHRAARPAAGGAWLEGVVAVNGVIDILARSIAEASRMFDAATSGELSARVIENGTGDLQALQRKINSAMEHLLAVATAVSRVSSEVGVEGRLGVQLKVPGVTGSWKDATDNVNRMVMNFTAQVRGIAIIVTAVTNGDLDRKLVLEVRGEVAMLADAINGMVDTLAVFASQITDVARQVGVEGRLGGQAKVPGTTGQWRGVTDSVNRLAAHPAKWRRQQEELQHTNKTLRDNATQLARQIRQIEDKGREVEVARAALEEKAAQLALSSQYKSEFLANMSHELRTPLNSLLILAQMLAENAAGNLTPRQVEYARTIQTAGNDLLAQINDVLDLAKIESGTVTLHVDSEPFLELRNDLDRAFRQIGRDKGLEFRISMERDLPPLIRTDAKSLHQILKNLLSNAFKFTARGTVLLEVGMAGSGWTPGHTVLDAAEKVVAFSVIDTGIGIAPEKQQIIFEAFQQADGSTSRNFGGTGLGLSISVRLSALLGGEIKVRSTRGEGSTFTLYLPLDCAAQGANAGPQAPAAVAQPAAQMSRTATASVRMLAPPACIGPLPAVTDSEVAAQARATTARPELAGKKVLLVDDDIRNIFALTSLLEEWGMAVIHAENGLDGIEILKNNPETDLILMDMMMPELDGYDTIRAIRHMSGFEAVPIVGISAKAMKGDREKCIRAGASDYLTKPVNVGNLLSVMANCLTA